MSSPNSRPEDDEIGAALGLPQAAEPPLVVPPGLAGGPEAQQDLPAPAAKARAPVKRKPQAADDAPPAATRRPRRAASAAPPAEATGTAGRPAAAVAPEAAESRRTAATAEDRAAAAGPGDAPPPSLASGFAATRQALEALPGAPQIPERLKQNIERIEALSARLVAALAQRRAPNPAIEAPGPDLYLSAAQAWLRAWAEDPARLIQAQTKYWGETLRHYAEMQTALVSGTVPPDEGPADPRFRNPLWTTNPWFNFLKRQYQINSTALAKAVAELEMDDPTAKRRIAWFTRQMIDMMAPTNFLATNPDALGKAIETEGESLVKGLENLVADVESGDGRLIVSLVDKSAFAVGENIATTPGEVVFRHPMFELIQYGPTTGQVHAVPLILFPPWINKFYILDLKPENSLIRYLVDHGQTLFVVSWKNPDGSSMADVGMDDYVQAFLTAMDEVLERTGQPRLNAVGYCIGGTTLSLALALLKARGDDRVNSATFFTTLTDFSELGEFTTFLQDDFLSGIEEEVARTGVLGAQLMARTFSFLRANDLIWGPAIRSYMLGETPPAFDLLYWNADATNLPGRMAVEYLRGLCRSNSFAGDGYKVLGESVRLSDLTLPMCSIACEGDHIAPWLDCWRGFSRTGSQDRTFILSQSGHIAGIVNPPTRVKYGHYTSQAGFGETAKEWRAAAEFHEGSWWPTWLAWLTPRSGPMVPARVPEHGLAPAPGTYVHEGSI